MKVNLESLPDTIFRIGVECGNNVEGKLEKKRRRGKGREEDVLSNDTYTFISYAGVRKRRNK